MTPSNSFSPYLNSVNQDAGIWDQLSRVKENEKIELDLNSSGDIQQIRASSGKANSFAQAIFRTINKTFFNTVADMDSMVNCLAKARQNTKAHVQKLANRIAEEKDPDPAILKEAMDSLVQLKQNLVQTANEGYEKLGGTYEKRVAHDGRKFTEVIRSEQEAIHKEVLPEISKTILDLGAKIQEKKLREAMVEKEKVENDKRVQVQEDDLEVSQAFNILAPQIENLENPDLKGEEKFSNPLIDSHFDERWEAKERLLGELDEENTNFYLTAQKGWLKEIEDPTQSPKKLIKGVNVDLEPKQVKNSQGKVATMPKQFALDLPRMHLFRVNGHVSYSVEEAFKYDPVTAYEDLKEAFEKASPQQGEILANRAASFINQAIFADLNKKTMVAFSTDQNFVVASGTGQIYEVDIDNEKQTARFILKIGFTLINSDSETLGNVLVKREIEVSLKELAAPDIEKKEDPLPSLTSKDTFSPLLYEKGYVVELLPSF